MRVNLSRTARAPENLCGFHSCFLFILNFSFSIIVLSPSNIWNYLLPNFLNKTLSKKSFPRFSTQHVHSSLQWSIPWNYDFRYFSTVKRDILTATRGKIRLLNPKTTKNKNEKILKYPGTIRTAKELAFFSQWFMMVRSSFGNFY